MRSASVCECCRALTESNEDARALLSKGTASALFSPSSSVVCSSVVLLSACCLLVVHSPFRFDFLLHAFRCHLGHSIEIIPSLKLFIVIAGMHTRHFTSRVQCILLPVFHTLFSLLLPFIVLLVSTVSVFCTSYHRVFTLVDLRYHLRFGSHAAQ